MTNELVNAATATMPGGATVTLDLFADVDGFPGNGTNRMTGPRENRQGGAYRREAARRRFGSESK